MTEHNGEGEYELTTVSIEQSTDADNSPIIGLTGELDLSTIDTLRPVLDAIVAQQPERITFKLNDLTFLDSSGIALLAEAAQGVETVVLENTSALIRRVLESTGLKDMFRFEP